MKLSAADAPGDSVMRAWLQRIVSTINTTWRVNHLDDGRHKSGLTIVAPATDTVPEQSIRVFVGLGSPEGVVTAWIGALYLRTDGSSSTTLYVKTANSGG